MLRRSNHTSNFAPLLASTVVKFGASGLSNCGLLKSDVVRHETFSMPVSSMTNVPAVKTSTSSAYAPATNGPDGDNAMEPICSGRYFEYGILVRSVEAVGHSAGPI